MAGYNEDGSVRQKSGPKVGSKNLATSKGYGRMDLPTTNKFLKRLEKTGNMVDAASFVGVVRGTIYKKMERDVKFKQCVELARERALAGYERELDNRIYEGNSKEEYDGEGNLTRRTVTKDNTLLVKALEVSDRDKWGKPEANKGNTTIVNVGDSAVSKLAAFLKVDLPETEKEVGKGSEDTVEGEWEESGEE